MNDKQNGGTDLGSADLSGGKTADNTNFSDYRLEHPTFRVDTPDAGKTRLVYVLAAWPGKTTIAKQFLTAGDDHLKVDGDKLTITVENGAATYIKVGETDHLLFCDLEPNTSSFAEAPPVPDPTALVEPEAPPPGYDGPHVGENVKHRGVTKTVFATKHTLVRGSEVAFSADLEFVPVTEIEPHDAE